MTDENQKKLKINLYGDLAGILSMASGTELKQKELLTQSFLNNAHPAGAQPNFTQKQVTANAGAGG